MRTCASCGKANNPTRKYCTRCGKPLISVKDEEPSPVPESVVTETKIPDVTPATSTSEQYKPSDSVKPTTDDEWVRPSQVARDRVRSSSSSRGKSEMEKAKEAFARAEGVGIEEADGSGVIETRMLRASEVRELMGEGAVLPQEPASSSPPPAAPAATPAPSTAPPTPAGAPPGAPTPASTTPSPPTQPAVTQTPPAAAPTPAPAQSTPVTPSTNKTEVAATPKAAAATPPPAAPQIPSSKPPASTPAPPSTSPVTLDKNIPEIKAVLSEISEPEDLQDSKIKDLIANLTTQHAELRKAKDDLEKVSTRLDEFVRSCLNDSEVKRIHYESLCEQERIAKKEYESAKKEYERVDKRRKKEVSNLEDRVKGVEKDISKSEDEVKKRIKELDKVREKIAQLQDQDS